MLLPRARRNRRPRLIPSVVGLETRQLLSADVLTYHNDNARDGANAAETTLTPADVNSADFGKVGFLAVDGKVDAQPVIKTGVTIPGQGVHDVVYVATENDSLYAFDATSGALLWHDGPTTLIPGEVPVLATDVDCPQVEPTLGITSTPVIDPSTSTIYVVAMSKSVVNGTTTFYQRIHAIDLGTGADKVAPRAIDQSISVPGAGPGGNGTSVVFDPKMYEERDALTLSDGVVYTGWASHCDIPPYTGWIIGFRASDLSLAAVANVDPNGTPAADSQDGTSGGSFWNSGGGFAADAAGTLYNISANGPFSPAQGDYGDAYLKLATAGGTTLTIADYFAPTNQQALANSDTDLGSSGVVLLPDTTNAAGVVEHLMVGSGKDGNIYLLNRDNLGQFNASTNQIVQEVVGQLGGGEFGTPAYSNGSVYFGAVGSTVKAFSLTNGVLSTTPTSQTSLSFAYPGTTVAVSSDGTANGIVWAAENGNVAALHAYNAANLADELYNSNQAGGGRDQFGAGNKFITPTVANGHVYVGTTDGVAVFGLLTPPPPVVVTAPVVAPPTVAVAALSSPTITVGGPNQLAVLGADTSTGESSLTYTWSVLSTPAGAPTPVFTLNGTNLSKLVGVGIAAPGAYAFRVTIQAPDGQVATSDVAVTATIPVPFFRAAAFAGSAPTLGSPLTLGALAGDEAFADSALTYTWTTLSTPKGARAPRFTANNANGARVTMVGNLTKAGTYVFQVRVTNPFGQTATSEESVVIGARRRG